MSKLSDLKNVNEHINQGTLYQEKLSQTLGTFSILEDNEPDNTYGILEPFLAITQQTDGNDDEVGSGAGYSDLSLNELYVIYKEKLYYNLIFDVSFHWGFGLLIWKLEPAK